MVGRTVNDYRRLFDVCTELMEKIQSIPQPVIAKVHALATAAGCQLVATCDLAIAAESAAFAIPGGRGGLFCHTPLVAVARNIGRKRAAELAMTGDTISARQALDWGLVNAVAPAAQPAEAVHGLLCGLGTGGASEVIAHVVDVRLHDHTGDVADLFASIIEAKRAKFHERSFEDAVVFGQEVSHRRSARSKASLQ